MKKQNTKITGVVTAVQGPRITVANKFFTREVNLDTLPSTVKIVPGEKIKIEKNLQGKVLSVKVKNPYFGVNKYSNI